MKRITKEQEAHLFGLPVCECGQAGSWHGKRNGHRVFCCDSCWRLNLKERTTDWEDTAKNWEDI